MKTKKFDEIFYLISYWVHEDSEVINELNNNELSFYTECNKPFIKELNKNLLENVTTENKNDIIKFYLFKFKELEYFFKHNKTLLFEEPCFDKNLNKNDAYAINCHYLYDGILTEIQYCCGKYNIDFWRLCKEVNLDLLLFDSGMTAVFKESESKQLNQKSSPKHENIFCNNGFELFEDILSEYVKPIGKKGRLSDIHYYYWKMYEDDFIHQRPERFKTWFFETYEKEDLGKIKTLKEVENLDRNIHYETALGWFKQQHH